MRRSSLTFAPQAAPSVDTHGLRPAPAASKGAARLPAWKTVTLGTHASVAALRHALKMARCSVGELAGEALRRPAFTVRPTQAELRLTALSVAELGFESLAVPIAEIHARGCALGLELCPPEAGPQLRLQYQDQPLGEFLHIAMAPIATDHGDVGFVVGNGGANLFLIGRPAYPGLVVPSTLRLVFARRSAHLARSAQPESRS